MSHFYPNFRRQSRNLINSGQIKLNYLPCCFFCIWLHIREIHSFTRTISLFTKSFMHSSVKYLPTSYSALVSVQVMFVWLERKGRGGKWMGRNLYLLFVQPSSLSLLSLLTPENAREMLLCVSSTLLRASKQTRLCLQCGFARVTFRDWGTLFLGLSGI